MGIDLEGMRDKGDLLVAQVDAAEISPGEFAHKVRKAVEKDNIRTVIIDSLNGYRNAMPQEQYLTLHMHELLQYLNRVGAATFLTIAQHGMVGNMKSPGRCDVSRGYRHPASLLRSFRRSKTGNFH